MEQPKSLKYEDLKDKNYAIKCNNKEHWELVKQICGFEWLTPAISDYRGKDGFTLVAVPDCISLSLNSCYGRQDVYEAIGYTIISAADFIKANEPQDQIIGSPVDLSIDALRYYSEVQPMEKYAVRCETLEEFSRVSEICGYSWMASDADTFKTSDTICITIKGRAMYDDIKGYTMIPTKAFIQANTAEQQVLQQKALKFKKGHSYLVKDSAFSHSNQILKVTIVDITDTCYNYKFEHAQQSHWETIEKFEKQKHIVEDLGVQYMVKEVYN